MSLVDTADTKDSDILSYFVALPITIFAILYTLYTYKIYAAEYYVRQAAVATQNNDGNGSYENQRKAVAVFPKRSEYRDMYALTNIAIANEVAAKSNLTEDEKTMVSTLVSQAIREVRVSTEALNPLSVSGWETRATIYKALLERRRAVSTRVIQHGYST
jgi:hypothetical protein